MMFNFSANAKQSKKGDLYGSAVVTAPSVCEETGGPLKLGGPYWSGVLHEQWVVDRYDEKPIKKGTN